MILLKTHCASPTATVGSREANKIDTLSARSIVFFFDNHCLDNVTKELSLTMDLAFSIGTKGFEDTN
jgi:hypothetical protein